MGDLVDLSQYAKKPEVVQPEPVIVGSVEIEVLRFAGGPLGGKESIVSRGAASVVVPGVVALEHGMDSNLWPGLHRYNRLSDRWGDRMVYAGPTEQPGDEAPYVASVKASELPGAVKWDEEDSEAPF